MKLDFSGKVALVTGATRGIGKQVADDFHALGAKLILTGTNREEIKALNDSEASKDRNTKEYYCLDFTIRESTEAFVAELEKLNRIDICVNNAGINRIKAIEETEVEDWDDMIAVNLKGPYLVTRAVSKIMKKTGYGRIINMASIWGVISREKRSIYSATKFGLRGFTVAVSNELARYGILVNAVSPGFVLTDLTKRSLSKKEMEEIAEQLPIRRLATPDEISRVVLFLASELNTYITGKNIIVDGGYVDV